MYEPYFEEVNKNNDIISNQIDDLSVLQAKYLFIKNLNSSTSHKKNSVFPSLLKFRKIRGFVII